MDFNNIEPIATTIYQLLLTMGELLVMTWPGRLLLGVTIGWLITNIARA